MRIVAAGGADITITSPLQAAGADALTNSTSGIPTYDLLSGFNGTTWDRLRALGDDSDGVASASLGRLLALARLSGYNGASWDRLLSEGNDRDAIATTTLGNLQTLGFPHSYNGTTWDRSRSEGTDRDAIAAATLGYLQAITFSHGFNGSTWDRVRTLGDTTLLGLGQLSVSPAVPGASGTKMIRRLTTATSVTRVTLATPTSGKKIRIVSCSVACTDLTTTTWSFYFGTGAAPTSDNANAVAEFGTQASGPASANQTWGDGAGPVGAADEVLSLYLSGDLAGNGQVVAVYREE